MTNPAISPPNLATPRTVTNDQLVLNGVNIQAQPIMVPGTSQGQGVMQTTGNPPPANIVPDTNNQVVDQSAVARTVSEANFAKESVTTPPPQGMGQQNNVTPYTGEVGIAAQQSAAQPGFVPGAEVQSVPNQVGQNAVSVGQDQSGRIPNTLQANATTPNATAQYIPQQQLVRTDSGTIYQSQNGQVTGQQVAGGAGAAAAGGAIIAGQGGQQVSQQSARNNQVLPLSQITTKTYLVESMNRIRTTQGWPVVNYNQGMDNIAASLYQQVLAGKLQTMSITSTLKASLAQQGYSVGKCIAVMTQGNTEQDVLNDWWNSPNTRSIVYQQEFNTMGGARAGNSWFIVLIQITAATQTANVQIQNVNQTPVATQA
ncbi:hypothetical protein IWQ61_002353 [Dispira simplex]|nr:hypothetical protein IWQ61_002353 [Dispira simplex]